MSAAAIGVLDSEAIIVFPRHNRTGSSMATCAARFSATCATTASIVARYRLDGMQPTVQHHFGLGGPRHRAARDHHRTDADRRSLHPLDLPVEPPHDRRRALADFAGPAGRIGLAPAHAAATSPGQFAHLTLGDIPECRELDRVRMLLLAGREIPVQSFRHPLIPHSAAFACPIRAQDASLWPEVPLGAPVQPSHQPNRVRRQLLFFAGEKARESGGGKRAATWLQARRFRAHSHPPRTRASAASRVFCAGLALALAPAPGPQFSFPILGGAKSPRFPAAIDERRAQESQAAGDPGRLVVTAVAAAATTARCRRWNALPRARRPLRQQP